MLNRRQKFAIQCQCLVSWIFAPIYVSTVYAIMRIVYNYRFNDIRNFRNLIKSEIQSQPQAPVIICANHLTMIDSVVINLALFKFSDYLLNWRQMPWNMPEKKNFSKSLVLRILCYLGKCLPVERGGSLQDRELIINKFKYLLSKNEYLCIFPEGTRSRAGRIKGTPPTYTVGQLAMAVPNTKILCLYARGELQNTWSHIPAKNDRFHFHFKFISPTTSEEGRRAFKAIGENIMTTLGDLEDEYFEELSRINVSPKLKLPLQTPHHAKS